MAGTIKTIVSTDPDNPRHMLRVDGHEWITLDMAALAALIASGVGDATGKGIELLNTAIHAKMIAGGKVAAPLGYDPITGEAIPMNVRLVIRVERDPANAGEAARILHFAATQKEKADARKAADALASERTIERSRTDFRDGQEFEVKRAVAVAPPAPPSPADEIRKAAALFAALSEVAPMIGGVVKALP